uniref:Uncharacterized protein n=1 Tax=Myoviridae sp. ct6F13 TaxID=2827602 RepID=A0A8S5LJD4_9CAUD|nr:MAG TPA: hypothetical protein [Myoviridae sp. ct6F13]DAE48832.1 MAG TPA: hypothetical protein [Caudoviricetes sp.]
MLKRLFANWTMDYLTTNRHRRRCRKFNMNKWR